MKKNSVKPIAPIVAFILSMLPFLAVHAQELSAEQVAMKAASVVAGAKSLTVGFTVTTAGHSLKGTVKTSGNRFSVLTPQVSSWYNGKELYTYNSKTKETTLTNPTAQELLESNPLLYVKSGAANFKCSFAPGNQTAKYVLDLEPKSGRTGIKKMTFTIDRKTYRIEKIVMNSSGAVSTVTVTSFVTGQTLGASTFDYPKSKFPGVEIVDLR